jgi:CheY-like chemotaxis protein
MRPTIAIVESRGDKALRDWLAQHTPARILEATPGNLGRLSSERIDLVLVDVRMPRASGGKVLDAMMKIARSSLIKILLITADTGAITKEGKGGTHLASWLNELLERAPVDADRSPTPGYPQGDWRSVTIGEIAQDMQVARAALAQMLGTTERNLARWASGRTKPRGNHEAVLQKIRYIHALLRRAFKREVIPRYLKEANPALGGRTPMMLLLAHDFAAVEANLLQMVEGVYT